MSHSFQAIKNRHVIIEYEIEGIAPVLSKIIDKYYPDGMRVESVSDDGRTVTVWVKTWAHIEYLRIASVCAEAEVLDIQPRPAQTYPLNSQ